jgi:hypothetical protein
MTWLSPRGVFSWLKSEARVDTSCELRVNEGRRNCIVQLVIGCSRARLARMKQAEQEMKYHGSPSTSLSLEVGESGREG